MFRCHFLLQYHFCFDWVWVVTICVGNHGPSDFVWNHLCDIFFCAAAFFAFASETFCAGCDHLCRKPRPVGFRVESFLRQFIFVRRGRLGPKVWTSEDTSIWLHNFRRNSSPYQMFCLVVAEPDGTSPPDPNHSTELDLCSKSSFHLLGFLATRPPRNRASAPPG